MNHDKLLAAFDEIGKPAHGLALWPKLRQLFASALNASYDKGYQDASEKAGHHFIYEVIPAEKEASREAGIREAIAAVEKMTVTPISAHIGQTATHKRKVSYY